VSLFLMACAAAACGARGGSSTDTSIPEECRAYEALYRAHLDQLGAGAASIAESRMKMVTERFTHASATAESRAALKVSCSSAVDALRASLPAASSQETAR
jgi:hypothetical protein